MKIMLENYRALQMREQEMDLMLEESNYDLDKVKRVNEALRY
jgi:hypothetical protein